VAMCINKWRMIGLFFFPLDFRYPACAGTGMTAESLLI